MISAHTQRTTDLSTSGCVVCQMNSRIFLPFNLRGSNYVFKMLSSHLRISYVSPINKIFYKEVFSIPTFFFLKSPHISCFY